MRWPLPPSLSHYGSFPSCSLADINGFDATYQAAHHRAMKRLILLALGFTAPFATSGAHGRERVAPQMRNRSVQPISNLRPLSEFELMTKARGHYLTPIIKMTDQCPPRYDIAGTITCSAPMNYYRGKYRITSNRLIDEVNGRKITRLFFKDSSGKLFVAPSGDNSAIEVAFYDTPDQLPDYFR